MVDGDVDLVQSNACIRHLARKFKLYGASEAEMAKVWAVPSFCACSVCAKIVALSRQQG